MGTSRARARARGEGSSSIVGAVAENSRPVSERRFKKGPDDKARCENQRDQRDTSGHPLVSRAPALGASFFFFTFFS